MAYGVSRVLPLCHRGAVLSPHISKWLDESNQKESHLFSISDRVRPSNTCQFIDFSDKNYSVLRKEWEAEQGMVMAPAFEI